MNTAMESIRAYFKGVKAEWGRISWPERRQIVAETISVIVIVFFFTIAIYCADLIIKGLIDLLNRLLHLS